MKASGSKARGHLALCSSLQMALTGGKALRAQEVTLLDSHPQWLLTLVSIWVTVLGLITAPCCLHSLLFTWQCPRGCLPSPINLCLLSTYYVSRAWSALEFALQGLEGSWESCLQCPQRVLRRGEAGSTLALTAPLTPCCTLPTLSSLPLSHLCSVF